MEKVKHFRQAQPNAPQCTSAFPAFKQPWNKEQAEQLQIVISAANFQMLSLFFFSSIARGRMLETSDTASPTRLHFLTIITKHPIVQKPTIAQE
jgi:hypothetical protein